MLNIEALEAERRQRETDARQFSMDLEALADREPAAWPSSLRTLLQDREAAAAEVRPYHQASCWPLRSSQGCCVCESALAVTANGLLCRRPGLQRSVMQKQRRRG